VSRGRNSGYHSLFIDGKTNEDAAWYHADPSDAAAAIRGRRRILERLDRQLMHVCRRRKGVAMQPLQS
jgi:hypothetical protein